MTPADPYINEIFRFLSSVTIKNTYFASAMKLNAMNALYRSDLADEENPYYQRLMGEYTIFDTPMYVNTIDTGETVLFSKANLEQYPKTKHAYQIGSAYWSQLTEKYPSQIDLIKGIRYPVTDLAAAIAAPNFTLLQYDANLLESQEVTSIVEAIEKHLALWRIRWDVKEFQYEEYYPITQWSALWSSLPQIIMAQRIANIKTASAHTFHIWEYLTSNGLGDYRSILTREQELFLYKNLPYLIQNRGKDATLTILADELLKPFAITLKAKSVVLNTVDSESNAQPVAEIISRDIRDTKTPTQAAISGYETVEEIFEREYANGLEPEISDKLIQDLEQRLSNVKQSWLPTKLVELNKIDLYRETHERYVQFVVESILFRQSLGKLGYNVTVAFSDTELTVNLSAGECIALICYCMEREYDSIVPANIPTIAKVYRPVKVTYPTIDEDFIYRGLKRKISHIFDYTTKLNRIPPNATDTNTPIELLNLLDTQFHYLQLDRDIASGVGNASYHIAYDKFCSQIKYAGSVSLNLVAYETYQEWFDNNPSILSLINTLNAAENVKEAFVRAGNDVVLALVPLNDSSETAFSKFTFSDYALMKRLFIQLCSFNIAFLDTERSGDLYHAFVPIVVNDTPIITYSGRAEFVNYTKLKPSQNINITSKLQMRLGLTSNIVVNQLTDLSNNTVRSESIAVELNQDNLARTEEDHTLTLTASETTDPNIPPCLPGNPSTGPYDVYTFGGISISGATLYSIPCGLKYVGTISNPGESVIALASDRYGNVGNDYTSLEVIVFDANCCTVFTERSFVAGGEHAIVVSYADCTTVQECTEEPTWCPCPYCGISSSSSSSSSTSSSSSSSSSTSSSSSSSSSTSSSSSSSSTSSSSSSSSSVAFTPVPASCPVGLPVTYTLSFHIKTEECTPADPTCNCGTWVQEEDVSLTVSTAESGENCWWLGYPGVSAIVSSAEILLDDAYGWLVYVYTTSSICNPMNLPDIDMPAYAEKLSGATPVGSYSDVAPGCANYGAFGSCRTTITNIVVS